MVSPMCLVEPDRPDKLNRLDGLGQLGKEPTTRTEREGDWQVTALCISA